MSGQPNVELREFLRSRRARVAPAVAGLPLRPGARRVPGLRREEVAQLAGVSVDYYVRLERGRTANVSESVLAPFSSTIWNEPTSSPLPNRVAHARVPFLRNKSARACDW
jgi:hypothetical protein